MALLILIIKNIRRKLFVKTNLFILATILCISILILSLKVNEELDDSFQNFTYPSMDNLYEVLNAEDVSNFTKMNDYRPRLTNNVQPASATNISVTIIVKSAMQNVANRDNIRETWGSKACRRTHDFMVYFALGHADNDSGNTTVLEENITEESLRHGDILRFNFVDTYVNNTYKVMAIMNHFVGFHSQVPYLLIVDDDFFVNPSILAATIANSISKFEYDRFFGGYVFFHNKPQRAPSLKWYVPKKQYQYDFYPPYASGGFLLISNPMVKVCDKLLPYLKYWSIDDVLLGILLFKLKIYPSHLRNVMTYSTWTLPQDLLAYHDVSTDMKVFWKIRDNERKC